VSVGVLGLAAWGVVSRATMVIGWAASFFPDS
jgi:hypothetical protein